MSTQLHTPEFLHSLIDNASYGFISTDTLGKITFINQQTLDFLHIKGKIENFLQMDFMEFFPFISPNIHETIQKCIYKNPKSFNIKDFEYLGNIYNIRGRSFPNGMIMSIFDVTEMLKSRNQDTLILLQGEELHRRKLYKELHDGIGPLISTVNLKLDVVKNEINEVQDKTIAKIDEIRKIMQSANNELRGISQTLLPSSLIDFGLVTALEELCKTISNLELIQVHFFQSGLEKRLDINLELGIFRIVQEIVSNTLNHAQAENIQIQIIKHDNYISLIVEDDGIGFDKTKVVEIMQKGVGLRNIKTRVKSFYGSIHIDANPEKGVIISIEFPINK